MATITGMTAARMLAIEAESITAARIDPVTHHLILTKHDGTDIDVGNVQGPQGVQGIPGNMVIPATIVVGPPAFGDAPVVGVGTDYARNDHKHGLPALAPASTVVGPASFGDAPVVGVGSNYAREDHKHGLPSAPGSSLISSQTLAAVAASITFSAIPQTFNHLKILALGRSNVAANNTTWQVRFNGDSAADYLTVAITDNASAVGGFHSSALATQVVTVNPDMPGASVTAAAVVSSFIAEIPCYAGALWRKAIEYRSGFFDITSGVALMCHAIGSWTQTAPITSITMLPAAGSFVVGSAFYLNGVN